MTGDDGNRGQKIEGDRNVQIGGDQINHIHLPPRQPPKRASPVHLQRVIRKLYDVVNASADPPPGYQPPASVDVKLDYNGVHRYRPYINDYGGYGHAVEDAYRALDRVSSNVRPRVTKFLRSLYRGIAASPGGLSADEILDRLIDELKTRLADVEGMGAEEIEPCCDMLVAHAVIGCTVLENPPADADH